MVGLGTVVAIIGLISILIPIALIILAVFLVRRNRNRKQQQEEKQNSQKKELDKMKIDDLQ